MSVLDSVVRLLSGNGRAPVKVPLASGEREQHRVVACSLFSGMSKAGGNLVLTNERLIFTPWSMQDLGSLLAAGFRTLSLPDAIAQAPETAVKLIGEPIGVPLEQIAGAVAGQKPSVFRPPSILVRTEEAEIEFGVLASLWSLNAAAANVVARDNFLATLHAQLRGIAPAVS